MATQNKTWERWSDEEVSALLPIYPGLRVAVYAVKLFAAYQ